MKAKFAKVCILKLGSIYTFLAILIFAFVDYKISKGMWWASGILFAMSDNFALFILLSSTIVFSYGAFIWLGSINSFVFKPTYSISARLLCLVYLTIAPVCAVIITGEIFGALLTDPFNDFKP